jgi:eukaryotic-like serine/threonine-protein kinase
MLGDYGEVLVLDWGLAKLLGRQRDLVLDGAVPVDGVLSEMPDPGMLETMAGSVFGTPSYMPPEQARGEIQDLGPACDVYALGAILYEILSGQRPYGTLSPYAVLRAVLSGPPDRMDLAHPVPEVLLDICNKAMARDPSDRFPDAGALAAEVGGWLEGSRRRDQALRTIERADSIVPLVAELRQRAESLRSKAAEILDPLKPSAPVEQKQAGWDLEDQAEDLEREVEVREAAVTQYLYAALTL